MAPPLVYDLLRLFCAASAHATSGLVRLDLACASHFFANWPGECLGLLCTPWGTRLFGRARVLRGLHQLESVWHEQSEAQDAPALAGLCARLHSPAPPPARLARLPGLGHGRLLAATGFVPGASHRAAPPGSLWVSVARPAPAPDPWLRPVLLLPDPAEPPAAGWPATAGRAAGLVLGSETARDNLLASLAVRRQTAPPLAVLAPPVTPPFLLPQPSDDGLATRDYFLLGERTPPSAAALRHLLAVWQALLVARGPAAPALVIAAHPVPAARRASWPRKVMFAPDLSGPAWRGLLRHARGLLLPEAAPGQSLALLEALALGTPVIAADLPALREAAGRFATCLPPEDAAAWTAALLRHADPVCQIDLRARLVAWMPMTPVRYFARLDGFLTGLA